ncbi:MAG: RidA family protein [Thermoplasmata archaeon]|nr:MAG: RidA family protein [Thermoplasmata archaeon]
MAKIVFQSKTLPSTKAPYSQAIIHENLLFISGQIAFDPEKSGVITGTLEEETKLTMDNIKRILEEAGSSLDKVLKVTVYLTDMKKFHKFNSIYKQYFTEEPPARSCVEVKCLPFDAKVEIEAIAHL